VDAGVVSDGFYHEIGSVADVGHGPEKDRAETDRHDEGWLLHEEDLHGGDGAHGGTGERGGIGGAGGGFGGVYAAIAGGVDRSAGGEFAVPL